MKRKLYIISLVIVSIIIILGLLPLFFNTELQQENIFVDQKSTAATQQSQELFNGTFEKVDYNVQGAFKVYQQGNKRFLRIENLDIVNGPDLYLVLSNSNQAFGNDNYQIISELIANKGSYNIEILEDIDFNSNTFLLIHCKSFSHTFASARVETIN